MKLNTLDLIVIAGYLVGIVLLGCWAGLRRRRQMATGEGYFLANKSLTWPLIGAALFSANISTAQLVAMAEAGYKYGMVMGNLEWMASFLLIVLALFFAPFYIRVRVATLPDFLERRYSRPCRDFLAIVGIVSAVFFHIGITLYAGAVLFENLFGLSMWTSIIVLTGLTGLYTIIGGLLAVVVTESLQALIMIVGSGLLTLIGLHKLGGWGVLSHQLGPTMMSILRPAGDPSGMPWYAALLGYPVLGLWYWCADQTITQRVLGAKDENHARVGALFCGFIKILPVFLFTVPGMILLAMVQQGRLAAPADTKFTYSLLVQQFLPVGLRGLVTAAMLAAVMSATSASLNSTAVLFSYDVFKRLRPRTLDHSLVVIGRWATVVAMIVSIIWTPIIGKFPSLLEYAIAIVTHISPPISVVFIWGVFWRRASARAAVITLWTGAVLGFICFLLIAFEKYTHWPISPFMDCFWLFVILSAVLVFFSFKYPQEHTAASRALVWDNPLAALRDKGWPGPLNYKFLSALLFAVMVILYWFFR